MSNGKRSRLFNRTIVIFLIGMILANIASRMTRPLISLYLQSLGAGVQQIGLFFTLTSIVPLAFQIFGGFVSDSIGRLQAVAIGSMAGIVGFVLFTVAPSWGWLFLAQGITALATCFVAPSFKSFIAEQTPEGTRGRAYAAVESIYCVVGVIGPPLGGYMSQTYGYRAMFALAGALYGAATVIRVFMARKAHRDDGERAEKMTFAGLKASLAGMVAMVCAGGIMTWLFVSDGVSDVAVEIAARLKPLYLSNIIGLDNTHITSLMSLSSLATMVLMPVGGWVTDHAGERIAMVAGHTMFAASYAVFLLGTGYAHFVLVWLLSAAGGALIGPAYNSLVSKVVPLNMRGIAFGLLSTSLGVISLPSPYLGGLLWKAYGPRAPFVAPLVSSLVLAVLLWVKLAPVAMERGAAAQTEAVPGSAAE